MLTLRILPAVALIAMAHGAAADTLEPKACDKLKTERSDLMAGGTKKDMEQGAAWAKANLPADRLSRIQRLIAVEEQLSFRCGEIVTAKPAMKEPPKPKDPEGKQAATPAADGAATSEGEASKKKKQGQGQQQKKKKKDTAETP